MDAIELEITETALIGRNRYTQGERRRFSTPAELMDAGVLLANGWARDPVTGVVADKSAGPHELQIQSTDHGHEAQTL